MVNLSIFSSFRFALRVRSWAVVRLWLRNVSLYVFAEKTAWWTTIRRVRELRFCLGVGVVVVWCEKGVMAVYGGCYGFGVFLIPLVVGIYLLLYYYYYYII